MKDETKRYFIDTEFIEDGKTIDLISIGIVCSDGREYYAVNQDAQLHRANYWVRENVLPHLPSYDHKAWRSRDLIRANVRDFVLNEFVDMPEFWGYCADYDWVAICQLFGTMTCLPDTFPKFCMDLKQLSVMLGSPPHPPEPKNAHNALADARWNRDLYDHLTKGKRKLLAQVARR